MKQTSTRSKLAKLIINKLGGKTNEEVKKQLSYHTSETYREMINAHTLRNSNTLTFIVLISGDFRLEMHSFCEDFNIVNPIIKYNPPQIQSGKVKYMFQNNYSFSISRLKGMIVSGYMVYEGSGENE
jgi:hypothetical protein